MDMIDTLRAGPLTARDIGAATLSHDGAPNSQCTSIALGRLAQPRGRSVPSSRSPLICTEIARSRARASSGASRTRACHAAPAPPRRRRSRRPAARRLRSSDVQADHLAAAGLVHGVRDNAALALNAATVADLLDLRVDENVRVAALQLRSRNAWTCSSSRPAIRLTSDREIRRPSSLDELINTPRAHKLSAQQRVAAVNARLGRLTVWIQETERGIEVHGLPGPTGSLQAQHNPA